jgi:hypothetical protein
MTETSENLAVYRYPLKNLVGDYLRAALGVGLLITPFFYSFGAHIMITLVLAALLILFGSFGISTALRQFSQVLADEHGLRQNGPRPVALPWNEVSQVDLRYFSTRREKSNGWFQVKVTGKGGQIKADSNLDDFDGLLGFLAAAVTRHDLPLSPIARENFQAAGFSVGSSGKCEEENL